MLHRKVAALVVAYWFHVIQLNYPVLIMVWKNILLIISSDSDENLLELCRVSVQTHEKYLAIAGLDQRKWDACWREREGGFLNLSLNLKKSWKTNQTLGIDILKGWSICQKTRTTSMSMWTKNMVATYFSAALLIWALMPTLCQSTLSHPCRHRLWRKQDW